MRISDWSSDVCSSDLQAAIAHQPDRFEVERRRHEDPAFAADQTDGAGDLLLEVPVRYGHGLTLRVVAAGGSALLLGSSGDVAQHGLPSYNAGLGRTACRERVCQYV